MPLDRGACFAPAQPVASKFRRAARAQNPRPASLIGEPSVSLLPKHTKSLPSFSVALLLAAALITWAGHWEERRLEAAPPPVSAVAGGEIEVELLERALSGRLAANALDIEKKQLRLEDRTLPLRDVLRIRFRKAQTAPRWLLSVRLADGTRLHGELLPSDDPDKLRLKVSSLEKTIGIPLEWVREIAKGVEVAPLTTVVATEDSVETTRNATISGVIETIGPNGVTIEDAALGSLELPWAQIERVRVAALDPAPTLPIDRLPCFVETDDGSRIHGALTALDPTLLTLDSPLTGKLSIPEAHRVGLELLLDRIAYLSDREPIEVEDGIPFSEYFPWTWRRDRNVLGNSLRIGRETFRKGIGVHSKCALTYGIEPGDEVFRAKVGIDVAGRPVDDNPRVGSVRFVVLLDGEEAYRSGDVGWADTSVPVQVPLTGHTRLTLLVEMGIGHHVLDRADWGDARILRK